MIKRTITEDHREDFLRESRSRIIRCSNVKNYNHLTNEILNNTFTFFVEHKLATNNKSIVWWVQNGKKVIECYGYTGHSAGMTDDEEDMKGNLYHEIFCYAEWIGRSIIENYSNACKDTLGSKHYNLIVA